VRAKNVSHDSDDEDTKDAKRVVAPAKQVKKQALKQEEKVQGYNVSVITGKQEFASTTANVYLTIFGTKGDSGKRKLNDDDPHFEQGSTDVFALEAKELGELTKIKIEHDGSGPSSSWFLEKVSIRDVISNTKYYFHANAWLSDDRGDMKRSIEVHASLDPNPPKHEEASPAKKKDDGFFAKLHDMVCEQCLSLCFH
jgi:hypothetical protein